jgi:hypothetical protein
MPQAEMPLGLSQPFLVPVRRCASGYEENEEKKNLFHAILSNLNDVNVALTFANVRKIFRTCFDLLEKLPWPM